MKPLKFSVSYNNDFKLLKKLVKIRNLNGNKVEEIYLPPPQEYMGSGRIVRRFSKKDLKKVLDFCRKSNLGVNLLLNSSCEGTEGYEPKNVRNLNGFIKEMHGKHGLKSLTIGDPFFIQKVKENVGRIKITVSVHSYIDSVQRAMFFEKMGADVLTLNRDINRDMKLLEEIKRAVNCGLRLLVNEGCLFKCPQKIFHDNWLSYSSRELMSIERVRTRGMKTDFFTRWCRGVYKSDLPQILKSPWIRPEDLRKYEKITDFFKITDGQYPTSLIIKIVKAYLNEFYNGNFTDLFPPRQLSIKIRNEDLKGFFEKVIACDKTCSKCHYCEKLAKRIIKRV